MISFRLIFFIILVCLNILCSFVFALNLSIFRIVISHLFIFIISIIFDSVVKQILANKNKIFSYFLAFSLIKFICFLLFIWFFLLSDSIEQLNHILNFFFIYFSYLVYDIVFLRKIA